MNATVTIEYALENFEKFKGWLYLKDKPWSLTTEGFFRAANLQLSPEDEGLERRKLLEEGWSPVVSASDVEDIVENLRLQNEGEPSIEQKFAAFDFFYENDAFIEVDQ